MDDVEYLIRTAEKLTNLICEVSDMFDDWNLTTELEREERERRRVVLNGGGRESTARERVGGELR